MRKVTRKVMLAFIKGESATSKNTKTDGFHVWLHGNLIAYHTPAHTTLVSLAGWNTPTTRDRLNGLLDLMGSRYRFCAVKGEPHIRSIKTGKSFEIHSRDWIDLADMWCENLTPHEQALAEASHHRGN